MESNKTKISARKKKDEAKVIAFIPPAVYVSKEKRNLVRDTIVKLFVNAFPHSSSQKEKAVKGKK